MVGCCAIAAGLLRRRVGASTPRQAVSQSFPAASTISSGVIRPMARKKIGLIGAGNIGGELANLAATKQLGDVVLFDIPAKEKFAQGKALDLEQATALSGSDAKITGTSNWEDLAGV